MLQMRLVHQHERVADCCKFIDSYRWVSMKLFINEIHLGLNSKFLTAKNLSISEAMK